MSYFFTLIFLDIMPRIIQWYEDYGDIFEMKMLGVKYVFLSQPELVKVSFD